MNKIQKELMYKSGIYLITNILNGKRYIGSSKNIYNRLHEHIHNLKRNKSHNAHLQSAWNKYKEDSFIWNVLEYCDEEIRFEREQFYISTIKPEYNLTENVIANFGHSPSKECREKISNTLKRRYASGEIVTFKNEQAWVKVYMYDIEELTLCKVFPNLHYTTSYFKSKSKTRKALLNRIYLNKYYLTDIKFDTKLELYNHYCEHYLVNIGNTGTKRYLNVACNNWRCVLKYAKQVDQFGISRSMLFKNINCSKSNPYISTKYPDLKFYYSNVFEPFSENAVVYGKPKQWLRGKIGETPEMDNSEVNK